MKLNEALIEVLKATAPIITLLISYLSVKLTKWLDTKIKDQELKNVVAKLNVIIPDVVKDIEQSFVLKEKNNAISAKLTEESAVAAKNMAIEKVKEQIGEKGMGQLRKTMDLTDSKIDSLIGSKVEARVFDLRKTLTVLLPFILFFTIGCHPTPLTTTATIIKTQEDIVKAGDEGVAKWYIEKHEICLKNGIVVREDTKKDGSSIEESRKLGLDVYNKCMANTTDIATKIADVIDLIRAKDKIAATVALSIAKGERPIESMGYVVPEVLDLVQKLTTLIKDAGIK